MSTDLQFTIIEKFNRKKKKKNQIFFFKIREGKTIMEFKNRETSIGWYGNEVTLEKKLYFSDYPLDQ